MHQQKISLCPVCRFPNENGNTDCVCRTCGFPYAFPYGFLGENSAVAWDKAADRYTLALLAGAQSLCNQKHLLTVNGSQVVFLSPVDEQLTVINSSGIEHRKDKVMQYSSAEDFTKNEVILAKDGTVVLRGDNIYGQNHIGTEHQIRKVIATSKCTYCITEKGEIVTFGQPVTLSVCMWNNVVDLAIGTYFVAALTEENSVLVTGNMINPSFMETINAWPQDIVSINASDDALIALRKDGRVLFAGKPYDNRQSVQAWRDITAVALDSSYAVGLTKSGNILLASSNESVERSFLDMRRKDAGEWREIVAIATSRSGIAGLDLWGNIHLVGNFRNIKKLQMNCSIAADEIKKDLLRASKALGLRY